MRSPLPILRDLARRRRPTTDAIPIGRHSFHVAHDRLHEIADERAKDRPDVAAFDPSPLATAPSRLTRWTADLRAAAAPLRLDVGEPTAELIDLLRTLAAHVDAQNEPQLLRLLGVLTGGVFRGPATFHLDVANACNVNCAYCWFHSPGSKNRADADSFDAAWRSEMVGWDTFTKIVDDLDRIDGREDVLLSGKGEPLLHPRCLDMVAYVKQRGLGLTLFSNGILVREDARQALVEHGCDLLYVSLSSATPEVYEALHPGHPGVEELGEVRANVKALTELKRQRDRLTPRVMMVDVLNCENAHEALAFYEQARDLGAEHVRFQLIHVQDYNAHLQLRPEQVAGLREQIAEAQRRADDGGPTIVDNIHYQLETLDPETGRWGHNRTPDAGCYVGWTFSRTWTNGDVSFCCSPKVVDNVHEKSFADIWAGERYRGFRNAAKDLAKHGEMTFHNGAKLLGDHCQGCPNYEGIEKLAGDLNRYGLDRFVEGKDATRL